MTIIAVVDNNGGMMFNHRRQSQDRLLREKVLELTRENYLWMNAYSMRQFQDDKGIDKILVSEEFLQKAGPKECCFVEDADIMPVRDKIDCVVLFRWNTSYPGDKFFPLDLDDGTWNKSVSIEFKGSSHPKITMEVHELCES